MWGSNAVASMSAHVMSAAQIFVFFPDDVKVGMKHIRTLAERMRSEGVQRAIMVAPVSTSSRRSRIRSVDYTSSRNQQIVGPRCSRLAQARWHHH